ncbi:MAG: Proline--tRNA ligase [Syntrophus sp. SKADARSKE-3]|nr:Proline--tRNA ligase [Syntrophus sp. SKADARSKE-3]
MRYSEMFLPTGREVPSDAEIISHQLMLRAGLIRKLSSGIYNYLPIGYRVVRKLEQIIREEMNRAGAQELHMPMVQPAELWKESGRWDFYGKELLRFRDRRDAECCLGPTHEEVITDLVRNEVKSYRQLPLNLYQIQTKYRDEIRPRFGVMRCREFGMKDAYSFDIDEAGAEISYNKMFEAYNRIFERCSLRFRPVEADTGSIGGSYSHEFLVMAESGEDAMAYCAKCGYAANLEKAEISRPDLTPLDETAFIPLEEVYTPDVRTIDEVCAFLSAAPGDIIKTLVFVADGQPVAILVRGDEEVNEIKVKNYLKCDILEMAMDDMIRDVASSPIGFVGPVGIKCRVIADYSIMNRINMVAGANKEDHHIRNANPGRDFKLSEYADLRVVREGDCCPRCAGEIRFARGIEVGHVFKLGTKYSKTMKAMYLDRNGKEQFIVMGCYGIGVGRTVAACIEQSHDDNGIVWPMALAPYHVIVTPVNMNEPNLAEAAQRLYESLIEQGIEVILDDRDERAGVKFKDADLIGIPLRITVGPKRLSEGKVEIKIRRSGENVVLPIAEAVPFIVEKVKEG